MNAPIGVFDSGIGGLTVAKEIMRQIPGEVLFILEIQPVCHMVPNQKIQFVNIASRIAKFLLTQDVKAIVIACNTASALAREELEDMVDDAGD